MVKYIKIGETTSQSFLDIGDVLFTNSLNYISHFNNNQILNKLKIVIKAKLYLKILATIIDYMYLCNAYQSDAIASTHTKINVVIA